MTNQTFFFVKTKGQYTRVDIADILFIQGCRNYVKIVTSKSSYMVLICMKDAEAFLPADRFIRIHKSYIIALDKIIGFNKFNVMLKDHSLPISNQYYSVLQDAVCILDRNLSDMQTSNFTPTVFQAAYA